MTHTIYLALGSNLGERSDNLQQAILALPPRVQPVKASSIYETPPWGYTQQPAFLNAALQAETDLAPHDLLVYLKEKEAELGRQPSFRYGPRLIDIDLLFYDDLVMNTPDLVVPHPRLPERAFVLVPVTELAPDLLHPTLDQTMHELLHQVDYANITKWSGPLLVHETGRTG